MQRGALWGSLLLAAILGLLTAFTFGTRASFVSIQIWIGATFAWLVFLAVRTVTRRFPVHVGRSEPLIRIARAIEPTGPVRPGSLKDLDRLTATSVGEGRSFDRQLRPRLIRLVTLNGLTAEDLGDAAWVLDPTTTGRAPTMTELASITAALPAPPPLTQEHQS